MKKFRSTLFYIILFSAAMLSDLSFAQNVFYHLLGVNSVEAFVWTGLAGDNNWTTTGNWSTNVAPGASNIAKFKSSACSGAACNANINANISVLGVDMAAGFSGTITQNATRTITLGSGGWTQASGTFAGGNANFTIDGAFNFSGGTFTATSAELKIKTGMTYTAGTFNHNNGTLRFDDSTYSTSTTISVSLPGTVNVYNLQYSGGALGSANYFRIDLVSGSFNVQNQFRIGLTNGVDGSIQALGGDIYLKGNLIVDPVNFTGTLGGQPYSNLIVDGTGAQTYTATGGMVPNLQINKSSGSFTPTGGTTNLVAHKFTLTQGSFTAPPGEFRVAHDFTIQSGTTYNNNGGSLNFRDISLGPRNYTISLAYALTTNNLSFGGGMTGSANVVTWTLAGAAPTINATGDLSISQTNGGTGDIRVNSGNLFIGGNFNAGARTGAGTATVTFNGTGTQTYTRSGAGANTIAGLITVDKSSGSTNLASAASFTTAGQSLTISNGTLNMMGFALTINNTITVAATGTLDCGGGTLTAPTKVFNGTVINCPGIGFTWTGTSGDNKWSTASNWSGNAVPGSSDIATFGTLCSGANCNVNIDMNINVKGIFMHSAYTGTITQNATRTITVGNSGWSQAGGTFTGGNSNITLGALGAFFQQTGGTFSAPSATVILTGGNVTWTTSGGTFNAGSSTVEFAADAWYTQTLNPGSIAFNHVTFTMVQYSAVTLNGTLRANGNLTIVENSSYGINGGTIDVYGNVNASGVNGGGTYTINVRGSSSQTVTSTATNRLGNIQIASTGGTVTLSGTLVVDGNWTYNSGTVAAGTSTVKFAVPSWFTRTVTSSGMSFNHVIFAPESMGYLTIGNTMTINGNLTFDDTSSVNGGTVNVLGNITVNAGGGGSALIRAVGSSSQTISGSASALMPSLEIASTGGTVTLSGTVGVSGNYTYTSGTVNAGTSTLRFRAGDGATGNIIPGAVAYNHVTFNGHATYYNLTGTLTVNGNLVLDETWAASLNGGTISAKGNVTAANVGLTGTTLLKITGSTSQTITGVSTALFPVFEVASTGGTVTYSGTLVMYQNFTHTSGTVNAGTSTLIFRPPDGGSTTITPGSVAYNNVTFGGWNSNNTISGTLTVNGTLTIDDGYGEANLFGGTIEAKGNVSSTNRGRGGTTLLKIAGSSSQTVTGVSTASFPVVEIASTGGTVSYSGTIVLRSHFTHTSGTVNAGTSTLYFAGPSPGPSNIIPSTIVYNNVTIGGWYSGYALTGTLIVNGTLTLEDDYDQTAGTVNGGTIEARGNTLITSYGRSGTTALTFAGSSNSTFTRTSGNVPLGAITVNKGGGASLILGSAINFGGATQDLTISAGTLDMAGYNLTLGRNITNSGTLKRGNNPTCGVVSYGGTYSGTASVCP